MITQDGSAVKPEVGKSMNMDPASSSRAEVAASPNWVRSAPGGKGKRSLQRSILIPAAILLVVAAGICTYLHFNGPAHGIMKKERAVPVNVAVACLSAVPIQVRSIGNVTPYTIVNITPQVSGQLLRVFFSQGQLVKSGDLLFEIDPRPYRAALNQAEGNVAKDTALVEAARANLSKDKAQVGQLQANLNRDVAQLTYASREKVRYAELVEQGAVSHEQSDQVNTSEAQATATIEADKKAIENVQAVVRSDEAQINTAIGTLKADQGAAESVRIQLGWTQIRSPIDGRTSSLNVYQGNVVTANSTNPIVTITQVRPIYVTVTIPEQYLNDVRRAQQTGSLKMEAEIEGSKKDLWGGTISFMENTVNTSTGTIMLRASFDNNDMHLYPGQFVDVVLTMPPSGPGVVIPARAIQTTQQGHSVYIVKADGTVELRTVKIGQTFGEQATILEGLSASEVVVIDGHLQLTPGARVKVLHERAEVSRGVGS